MLAKTEGVENLWLDIMFVLLFSAIMFWVCWDVKE